VRETHQIAEAQQEKNAKLREAFGISEYFVEGSSLDPNRRAKEAAAAQQAAAAAAAQQASVQPAKKYALVRTPSPEPTSQPPDQEKSKKRKRRARDRYVVDTGY
jgi:serine/arginine repetitive matrix protein 2